MIYSKWVLTFFFGTTSKDPMITNDSTFEPITHHNSVLMISKTQREIFTHQVPPCSIRP